MMHMVFTKAGSYCQLSLGSGTVRHSYHETSSLTGVRLKAFLALLPAGGCGT